MEEPNRDLTLVSAAAKVATIQGEVNQPEGKRYAWETIQDFKGVLEPLARLGAILFGATYLLGFLIVIQHHADFGIVDVGVFRARVMAAGILFDVLTILPIILASRIYGWLGLSSTSGYFLRTRDEDRVFKEIILATSLYIACAVLANLVSVLFTTGTQDPNLWFMLGLVPAAITAPLTSKYSFDHIRKMAVLNVVSAISFGWSMTMLSGRNCLWRSLWFYACGLAMRFFRGTFRGGGWRKIEWERNLGLVLGLLLFFSISIYGTVKFQFGGVPPSP